MKLRNGIVTVVHGTVQSRGDASLVVHSGVHVWHIDGPPDLVTRYVVGGVYRLELKVGEKLENRPDGLSRYKAHMEEPAGFPVRYNFMFGAEAYVLSALHMVA